MTMLVYFHVKVSFLAVILIYISLRKVFVP